MISCQLPEGKKLTGNSLWLLSPRPFRLSPQSLQSPAVSAAVQPIIRLVAIDLDGTLLNDAKEVAEHTAEALRCLPQRGIRAVIASARPPRSVRRFYHALGLDTWQINYNGALIWDEPERLPVFHRPMTCKLVLQIIRTARQFDERVLVSCEILDRWYTDRFDPEAAQTHTTETGKLFKPDVVAAVGEFCTQPVTKLMLLGPGELMRTLGALLATRYAQQVSIIRSDEDLLQIMDRRCSKGAALRRVAKHYNIPMEQVMAIGDAVNDIDMLQAAGVAIAMDNAHSLVKQAAHWIAPSNNDHGVHAALVRYGLCDG